MKPEIQIGSGKGWLQVPYQVLPLLRRRWQTVYGKK
jgi:hypothetical protein